MGYLTLYARIQNLVKCEAPGAKNYGLYRTERPSRGNCDSTGSRAWQHSDNHQRTLAHRRLQD